MRKFDAFICYNRANSEDVYALIEEMRKKSQLDFFIDKAISPGENWASKIEASIISSSNFLFFIKENPTSWQMHEINIAFSHQTKTGKPKIIPVILPNASKTAFRQNNNLQSINKIQAAEFSNNIYEHDVIDSIIRSILETDTVYISNASLPRADKLPAGFKADLGRITELLIGQAVYKEKTVCIRELIQNARDACSRQKSKQRPEDRPPEIIVYVDPDGRFLDIIDYGDGMTADALANSFAVLGKSLNEVFHKIGGQSHHTPITGKFGIGFISTFMIAHRVQVSTRALDEESYHFEISSPLSPFDYNEKSLCARFTNDIGTTMRVYFKNDIFKTSQDIIEKINYYCRHVPDLYIFEQSHRTRKTIASNWNTPPLSEIFAEILTEPYEVKLAWADGPFNSIKISSGGFYVAEIGHEILGDFPNGLIAGEINVAPGLIDLTISRDSVVYNDKVQNIRDILSRAISMLHNNTIDYLKKMSTSIPFDERNQKISLIRRVKRSICIFNYVIRESTVGEIKFTNAPNPIDIYRLCILNEIRLYLAESGAGIISIERIEAAISSKKIRLIVDESFDNSKIFSHGKVLVNYVPLKTERYEFQLRARSGNADERIIFNRLATRIKLEPLSEMEGWLKYYAFYRIRGILFYIFKILPGVKKIKD